MATTRVQLNLKIPPQLRDAVTTAARAEGVSTNRWCEFALATFLRFMSADNPVPHGDRVPPTPSQ